MLFILNEKLEAADSTACDSILRLGLHDCMITAPNCFILCILSNAIEHIIYLTRKLEIRTKSFFSGPNKTLLLKKYQITECYFP